MKYFVLAGADQIHYLLFHVYGFRCVSIDRLQNGQFKILDLPFKIPDNHKNTIINSLSIVVLISPIKLNNDLNPKTIYFAFLHLLRYGPRNITLQDYPDLHVRLRKDKA